MMGCGSSMEASVIEETPALGLARLQQNGIRPKDIVRDYVSLDEKISELESSCPGPRMATMEAWIVHLQKKRGELLGLDGVDGALDKQHDMQADGVDESLSHVEPTTSTGQQNNYRPRSMGQSPRDGNDIVANTPTKDLANLAFTLGVVGDAQKASTHEDFFANLSESALYLLSIRYYTELLEHTKMRLKMLVSKYAELNELYVNQDGIIAFISGGTYMSRLEETIDAQLETSRDVRDKLGSTMEQWRICGHLLRAAANMATQMLHQWRQLPHVNDPRLKIQSVLECRSSLHASLTSLDCAQLALPHVELKHISNRQLLTVRHCNTYLITDIANQTRFEHTAKVFTAYESNISKACTWLYETFNKTLRKDFDKAEDTVRGLAKTLREHREEIFTAVRK